MWINIRLKSIIHLPHACPFGILTEKHIYLREAVFQSTETDCEWKQSLRMVEMWTDVLTYMKEWFYLSAVFQRIASIVEIPSLNEREQKLFNAPPGTALLQPHSSFRVHRLCAGQHISILCISSAWGGGDLEWPFSLEAGSYIFFQFPPCSSIIDEQRRWVSALCSIDYDENTEQCLPEEKPQIEIGLNIPELF